MDAITFDTDTDAGLRPLVALAPVAPEYLVA